MSWCHCFLDPDYHYVQPGNLIGFWSYCRMISNYCCLHWCLSPRGSRSSLCFPGSYIADMLTRVHAPIIVIFSTPSKINKIIKLVRIKIHFENSISNSNRRKSKSKTLLFLFSALLTRAEFATKFFSRLRK